VLSARGELSAEDKKRISEVARLFGLEAGGTRPQLGEGPEKPQAKACGDVAENIATVLVSGTVSMPTPAEAAKMSNADKVALKQATVACKAERKALKVRCPASRKYVKNCNHKDGGSQRPT